jgi:hypothetical protein
MPGALEDTRMSAPRRRHTFTTYMQTYIHEHSYTHRCARLDARRGAEGDARRMRRACMSSARVMRVDDHMRCVERHRYQGGARVSSRISGAVSSLEDGAPCRLALLARVRQREEEEGRARIERLQLLRVTDRAECEEREGRRSRIVCREDAVMQNKGSIERVQHETRRCDGSAAASSSTSGRINAQCDHTSRQ